MSLGRHAYRHAIQPSCLIDHVWISEDLLKSSFRRFAKNHQRRYESRVPGPLEARKRLAKRRNTALAGITGSGPLDDIACLFGRNGREHMKWTDGRGRTVSMDTLDSHAPPSKPTASRIPFYNENLTPQEFGVPPSWPAVMDRGDRNNPDRNFSEILKEYHLIADFKDAIRQFGIDLRREPAYSRLILNHLLSYSASREFVVEELILFLDDPYLNIRGAGNYLATIEHHFSHEMCLSDRRPIFGAIIKAIELGLVPPDELSAIIKILPKLAPREECTGKSNGKFLSSVYRDMWDAIGRCDIYRHKDLDKDIIDGWLGILWAKGTHNDLLLAKDIISTAPWTELFSIWAPRLIIRYLDVLQRRHSKANRDYISKLLRNSGPETVTDVIIHVTESLVSAKKKHLLEKWRAFLPGLQDIEAVVSLGNWAHVETPCDTAPHSSGLAAEHQIILRLWLLRTLSKALPEGPLWRRDLRATDPTVINLFNLYELLREDKHEDFLSNLMKGIHELGMPYNGLLMLAVDLKAGKSMTKPTRSTLKRLELSNMSFSKIFTDLNAYNLTIPHFFPALERIVRQIDITSADFVQHGIHIARTGDTAEVWNLIRLLRSHTPLKIALAKSWQPIPDPSDMALIRYYPEPRTADCPDPHAALEMINLLAISFSCSKNFSPRRAFELVRWLYTFLLKHSAPVQPALVRALYHAGVVRFRREGLRVSPTQYAYIFDIVKKTEGPEVVKALMDPFR